MIDFLWYTALVIVGWLVVTGLVTLALLAVIRHFVVQAFKIPSGSMIPTLLVGDHLLVNKLVYRFRLPQRGEVVVFKFPQDGKTDFIKRIVALPGDEVALAAGRLIINGKEAPDPHASYGAGSPPGREREMRPFRVPRKGETVRLAGDNIELYRLPVSRELGKPVDVAEGRMLADGRALETWQPKEDYLFMMGDNRDNSFDSRFWGPVALNDVVGKAMIIYWSFGDRLWRVRWPRIGDVIH